MSNIDYQLSLSPEQRLFWQLLERFGFTSLWDMKERIYYPEKVNQRLGTASKGEALLLRFCLGVWRHDNEFEFDFVDAASTLEPESLEVVTSWMKEPFWP